MKMFNIFKKKKELKRYYREWLSAHGWGVMVYYDTTWANSQKEAAMGKPVSAYTCREVAESSYLGYYDTIIRVQDEHLNMSDDELSKIYGCEDEGN